MMRIVIVLIILAQYPDPNLPSNYERGFFRFMCNAWCKTPTGYLRKITEPNKPPSSCIVYGGSFTDPNDPEMLLADYVVKMDKVDMHSFGMYAKIYRGELKFVLPPLPPPESMTKMEVVVLFSEQLFMKME